MAAFTHCFALLCFHVSALPTLRQESFYFFLNFVFSVASSPKLNIIDVQYLVVTFWPRGSSKPIYTLLTQHVQTSHSCYPLLTKSSPHTLSLALTLPLLDKSPDLHCGQTSLDHPKMMSSVSFHLSDLSKV